jgi:protein-S-isoprenylcysteine O-methyltransferase Ste14
MAFGVCKSNSKQRRLAIGLVRHPLLLIFLLLLVAVERVMVEEVRVGIVLLLALLAVVLHLSPHLQ